MTHCNSEPDDFGSLEIMGPMETREDRITSFASAAINGLLSGPRPLPPPTVHASVHRALAVEAFDLAVQMELRRAELFPYAEGDE